MLAPVRGIFAAQLIKPQAKYSPSTAAWNASLFDYDALRGWNPTYCGCSDFWLF